ncbi:hypothetical protein CY35_11G107500 [Sphagnum magellanicum]|nr:hypothetical protein CY35_11G107500 [Sphagnum magellanicum]
MEVCGGVAFLHIHSHSRAWPLACLSTTTPNIGASSDWRQCSSSITTSVAPRDLSLMRSRRMSTLFSSIDLVTVGAGPRAGSRRIGDFGSRSEDRRRRQGLVCSQLAESSAKEVPEESSAGAKNKSSKSVLVVGATGGVGQLVVASLMERGHSVRAIIRNPEKGKALFGDQDPQQFQAHIADTRQQEVLAPSFFEGVTHVICCTGTTAFPSKRWDGDNGPDKTDWEGVRNLVSTLPSTIQHFVLVSSIGVTRTKKLPFNILNLFGVLTYKKMGEDFLSNSGIPYTIIRPGRLTDGPYTSYDLNTLLQATSGTRRDVIIDQGDTLIGEASRIVVAEACVQALDLPCTIGQTYEINSIEGVGPGKDKVKWETLFKGAHKSSSSK